MAALPDVPHFAVFDTAFHSTLPDFAREYALPPGCSPAVRHPALWLSWTQSRARGAERRHLSCGATWRSCGSASCHLGNGASVATIEGGRSVDTSMGMTPLEGLGHEDRGPGMSILACCYSCVAKVISMRMSWMTLLNKRSGLKGLTGTNDMREIERRASAGDQNVCSPSRSMCTGFGSTSARMRPRWAALMSSRSPAGVGEHSCADSPSLFRATGIHGRRARCREQRRSETHERSIPSSRSMHQTREYTCSPCAPTKNSSMARATAATLGQ